MKASFKGKVYSHRMTADVQRCLAVSIAALQLMQSHYQNKYLSFNCVSELEEAEWRVKAESLVPAVEDVEN